MKLSAWAKKQGISYITAWRWFNENRLPVKAYRSDSGTIIVQDETETSEQVMSSNNTQSNDVMSMVLKKTVEFSKNNGTVEDFAAWMLSTFTLKVNTSLEYPRYSRVKPKQEDVQKHFQQFIKKGEKPKPHTFVASEETINRIIKNDGLDDEEELSDSLEINDDFTSSDPELNKSFSEALFSKNNSNITYASNSITTYDPNAEGFITRSVDSTPQLNYTGSTNNVLSTNFANMNTSVMCSAEPVKYFSSSNIKSPLDETFTVEQPVKSKRGRKPSLSKNKEIK